MKIFIYIYYLFYILSGGYWHYSFANWFYDFNINNTEFGNIEWPFAIAEVGLMVLAFLTLILPNRANLHGCFFLVLLLLDVFAQNMVKFESSIILTHFIPLFFYLYTHNKLKKYHEEITYAAMLFVAVGFVSSCVRKIHSGWLSTNDLVVYNYLIKLNKGFGFTSLLGSFLIGIKSFWLWKLVDYSVLIFQLSYMLLFFNRKYFLYLTQLAICFHLLIIFTLNIAVFYNYILFYAIILYNLNNIPVFSKRLKVYKGFKLLWIILLIMFVFSKFEVHFFYQLLPLKIYNYVEYLYNFIALIVCFGVLLKRKINYV